MVRTEGTRQVARQIDHLVTLPHHPESGGREMRVERKRDPDATIGHLYEAERIDRRQLVEVWTLEV